MSTIFFRSFAVKTAGHKSSGNGFSWTFSTQNVQPSGYEPGVSVMFPNNRSVCRPLPSLLPGSDGTPSPAFHRYYVAAKTTVIAHPALRLSGVAPRGLELTSLVRSLGPGSPPPKRLGVVARFHPLRSLVSRRPTALPSSQGTPVCLCSVLGLRPSLDAWPSRHLGAAPRCEDKEALSDHKSFGAQSQSLSTRCLRFVPPARATTQNSLPGVASFPGWDFSVPTEFHWAVSALRPPPPLSLSWRDFVFFVSFCAFSRELLLFNVGPLLWRRRPGGLFPRATTRLFGPGPDTWRPWRRRRRRRLTGRSKGPLTAFRAFPA